MHDLTARRLALLDDGCNLAVADVEHVVQQEGRAFLRSEPFEKHEERHRKIVGEVQVPIGWGVGDDRLRQPGTHVRIALRLETPQAVDRQSGGRRDEPRFGILDSVVRDPVPADVRVLHGVFGIGS